MTGSRSRASSGLVLRMRYPMPRSCGYSVRIPGSSRAGRDYQSVADERFFLSWKETHRRYWWQRRHSWRQRPDGFCILRSAFINGVTISANFLTEVSRYWSEIVPLVQHGASSRSASSPTARLLPTGSAPMRNSTSAKLARSREDADALGLAFERTHKRNQGRVSPDMFGKE